MTMKAPVVLSIGEVLWDFLPGGPQLGGAPANFVVHAHALGAEGLLVSRVGDDDLGRDARRRLSERGVDLTGVGVDTSLPTGRVTVEVAADGQPRFTIQEQVAWDAIAAGPDVLASAARADVVCFGSLAQRDARSRAAIRACTGAVRPGTLRVFDINLRAPFHSADVVEASLGMADVLKLNETELPVLAGWFGLRGGPEEQLETLARRFGLRAVALTLGAAGSRLLRDGEWHFEPGREVSVVDAVGAGDSYTAALVLGLLRGWPTSEILRRATDIAAFVCTRAGATPELLSALREPFRS